MIKRITTLIAAALMLAAVVGLTSCEKTNYQRLDEEGYTVSVRFDVGEGKITGTDSTIIDVFNPSDYEAKNGKIEIPVLSLDDPKRKKSEDLVITYADHFLAGWYTERSLIDENDPSKGYTYSGKWDFSKDSLVIDADGEYTSAINTLVLYAAWVPYYEFEIYAKNETGEDELITTYKTIKLNIPEWEEGEVTLDMKNFPVRDGYTLDSVYSDEAMQNKLTGSVEGEWDELTATSLTPKIKLYTSWILGNRYRIYDAEDVRKNADLGGYYEILADLDFTDVKWPAAFANGKFVGTIDGGGHKITGISVETGSAKKNNGIFSEIGDGALIKNVSFENVTHVVDTGRIVTDSYYGLLAGNISAGATFKEVSVSGKLLIGNACQNLKGQGQSYSIGLVCGSDTPSGIDYSEIVCEKQNPDNERLTFTIEVNENGSLELVFPE